ncbi:MAG: PAS domain S-box protein, partial [Pseudomonadota bacterium]
MAEHDNSPSTVTPALTMRGQGDSAPGMDALYTQIAVRLLSLDSADPVHSLAEPVNMLRDATAVDAVFVALLTDDGQTVQTVIAATSPFTRCRPQVLEGMALTDMGALPERLAGSRTVEFSDSVAITPDLKPAATLFEERHMGACLLAGVRRSGAGDDTHALRAIVGFVNEATHERWPTDLTLLLKLLTANLGAGLTTCDQALALKDFQERDALMHMTANDGVWDFDGDTKKVTFSRRWKEMLGYDVNEENIAPDWYRLVHPEDMAAVQAKMRAHLEGRSDMFRSTHRMRHCNGDWHWVMSQARGIMDEKGRLLRLIGVEVDINERKLYEEALFREKESAQITLQSIGDGVITTDENNIVEYVNPVAEELTGWKVDDATGRPLDEVFRAFHEETCEPLENPLVVAVRRSRAVKSNRPILLIRRDGNELYIESTASPIRDGNSMITGGVLVFHDVSEARELNRKLSYHASHDFLTGLVNRREFEKRVERALKSSEQRDVSHVVCYLDL